MSTSSPDNLSLASLGADAGIPSLNVADIPANVRDGNQQAREAYVEGLAFEQILVGELTQQMASTLSGSTGVDGTSSYYGYDSTGSDSSSSGIGLSGASAFGSMIPQALTEGIMAGGGLGIADEIAAAVDPSIDQPESATATTGTATSTTDASGTATTDTSGTAITGGIAITGPETDTTDPGAPATTGSGQEA